MTIGVKMEIHNEEPADVYADFICANCDTPAAHKFNGTAGHSHDFHPCPYCNANIVDMNKPSGYDRSKDIFFCSERDAD
jgi:DNA-directed RNA polymerase subunit RPC12/RpoP